MKHKPFPGSPDDMMNTIAALRARVAKLEAGGEPNSYEARMDAYGKKIDELMARNAKLKAALKLLVDEVDIRGDMASDAEVVQLRLGDIRAALKDAHQ